jgi:hypothetical protein
MPLTEKGREIENSLVKEYGKEKGEQVLYAGKNKGVFTGIDSTPLTGIGAPYFGRPGAATQLNYAASNPGYAVQSAPVDDIGAGHGMDATIAWGAPYDLSGGAGAPARGVSATKEVEKASGLL